MGQREKLHCNVYCTRDLRGPHGKTWCWGGPSDLSPWMWGSQTLYLPPPWTRHWCGLASKKHLTTGEAAPFSWGRVLKSLSWQPKPLAAGTLSLGPAGTGGSLARAAQSPRPEADPDAGIGLASGWNYLTGERVWPQQSLFDLPLLCIINKGEIISQQMRI